MRLVLSVIVLCIMAIALPEVSAEGKGMECNIVLSDVFQFMSCRGNCFTWCLIQSQLMNIWYSKGMMGIVSLMSNVVWQFVQYDKYVA